MCIVQVHICSVVYVCICRYNFKHLPKKTGVNCSTVVTSDDNYNKNVTKNNRECCWLCF